MTEDTEILSGTSKGPGSCPPLLPRLGSCHAEVPAALSSCPSPHSHRAPTPSCLALLQSPTHKDEGNFTGHDSSVAAPPSQGADYIHQCQTTKPEI